MPRLVDVLPNGPVGHPTVRLFMAGGVPEVMLHLRRLNLLNLDCLTVAGELGLPGSVVEMTEALAQRGDQGVRVEMPAGQGLGHGQRMGDVGLAADAHLAAMRGVGKHIGGAETQLLGGLPFGAQAKAPGLAHRQRH